MCSDHTHTDRNFHENSGSQQIYSITMQWTPFAPWDRGTTTVKAASWWVLSNINVDPIHYEKFGGKTVDVLFQPWALLLLLYESSNYIVNRPFSTVVYLVKVVDWSKPRNALLLFYLISTILLRHTCNSPVMHLLFSLALKLLDQWNRLLAAPSFSVLWQHDLLGLCQYCFVVFRQYTLLVSHI